MVLYAIVSIPLLLYLYFGLGILTRPLDPPVFRYPLVKGAASFPGFMILLFVLDLAMDKQFTLSELFWFYLIRDTLTLPLLITLAALFACRKLMLRGDWELFTGMLVYSATVYALLSIGNLILIDRFLGPYELFLRPTLRMVELTVLTAATITVIRHNGVTRVIAVAVVLLLPPAAALVGAFETSMRLLPAVAVTVVLALGAVGTLYVGSFLGYVKAQFG